MTWSSVASYSIVEDPFLEFSKINFVRLAYYADDIFYVRWSDFTEFYNKKKTRTILYDLVLGGLVFDCRWFLFSVLRFGFRGVGRVRGLVHEEHGLEDIPEVRREVRLELVGDARDTYEQPVY